MARRISARSSATSGRSPHSGPEQLFLVHGQALALQQDPAIKNSVAKTKHPPFSLEPNSWTQWAFYVKAIEDAVAKGGKRGKAAA